MDWKLLGLIRVMHADGPDLSRSAAGRAGPKPCGCRPRCFLGSGSPGPLPIRDISLRATVSMTRSSMSTSRSATTPGCARSSSTGGEIRATAGAGRTTRSSSRRPGTRRLTGLRSPALAAPAGSTGPTGGMRASSSGPRSPTVISLPSGAGDRYRFGAVPLAVMLGPRVATKILLKSRSGIHPRLDRSQRRSQRAHS